MTPVIFIAALCLAAVVAFVRTRWALALTIVAAPAYLLKTSVAGVPVTLLEALIVGTILGWIVGLFAGKRTWQEVVRAVRESVPASIALPLLVAVIGWVVATLLSIDARASVGAVKAWLIEPALIGVVLLVEARRDGRTSSTIVRAILALLSWVSLAGFAQFVWFRETLQDARLSSVFAPVANYFAMFAAPLFVFAVGLATANRERVFALAASALSGTALLLSFSYGGFLAVLAGGLAIIVTMLRGNARRNTLLMLLAFAALVFVALTPTRHFREKLNFTTRSSSLVRTEIWRTAVEIGRQYPLTGIGPNTFEKEYRVVAPTLYHPPLEWLVAKPHHLYLNAWVETGILGLLGLVWASVAVLRLLFRAARSGRVYAAVVGASCIAILAHGFVDTPLFKNDLAFVAAVLAALGLAAAAETRPN